MAKSSLDQILSDGGEVPKSVPQTVKAAIVKANKELAQAQALVAQNAADLKSEDKVALSMAPMYRPYFGDVMTVSLNGLSIYFPLDGRSYKIPKSYAMIIQERRRRVDEHITRTQKLADVRSNYERSAGELELVPR